MRSPEAPATTRALVLRGAGGHFCSGADLTVVEGTAFAARLRAVLTAFQAAPFPTIAAVERRSLGAGTQLAVACDLRTTTPDAVRHPRRQARPDGRPLDRAAVGDHGRPGHGPGDAAGRRGPHRRGRPPARLAQRLCTPDEALDWADEIAAKAPLTITGHKLMLNASARALPDAPEVTAAFAAAWASEDFEEGLAAFHDRRPGRSR